MNFDTGEFYEKFLSRLCFRSDLTFLTATLHVCVYAYVWTSISVSIEQLWTVICRLNAASLSADSSS